MIAGWVGGQSRRRPPPPGVPPPPRPGPSPSPTPVPEPQEERLMSREELQRLLDQLAEIEEEALRVQQALTQKRRVPVEKDW